MHRIGQIGSQTLGLYLSVPFCRAKCSFCNFASGVGSDSAVEHYVKQLCGEIRNARRRASEAGASLPGVLDSVYFGGGTPSLLAPEQLQEIFHAVHAAFDLGADAEITLEAAPGQIGDGLLGVALELGVNRISLGVQSFVDREAQAVGRSHTRDSCLAEFQRLRRAGVRDLGADLIAGLPYQTAASWTESLKIAASASELDHLSVYMLEVDEDSRLGREVLGGGARLHAPAVVEEEQVAAFYEQACAYLPSHGFRQYEISNFAKQGKTSKHNLKYWTRAPYLGLGLDAHSMLFSEDGVALRWANHDDLRAYTGQSAAWAPERVDSRAAFEECVFLGLRLVDGLPWATLEPYSSAWRAELAEGVHALCREGLMGSNSERLWLTGKGRLLSGEIFGELLAGAVA